MLSVASNENNIKRVTGEGLDREMEGRTCVWEAAESLGRERLSYRETRESGRWGAKGISRASFFWTVVLSPS